MVNEGKGREKSELSTQKIIGRMLEVLAFAIMIVNFVLMTMKDKDLATIWLLLWTSACMLFAGMILSHLPHQKEKNKEES